MYRLHYNNNNNTLTDNYKNPLNSKFTLNQQCNKLKSVMYHYLYMYI